MVWKPVLGGKGIYSGVSGAPLPYDAAPTADTMRDALISLGLMEGAPAAPVPLTYGAIDITFGAEALFF